MKEELEFLTADRARMLYAVSANTRVEQLKESLLQTYRQIEELIKTIASDPKRAQRLELKWGSTNGKMKDTFPYLTDELYTWDIGAGRGQLTQAGSLLQIHFQTLGYKVTLTGGSLIILWMDEDA